MPRELARIELTLTDNEDGGLPVFSVSCPLIGTVTAAYIELRLPIIYKQIALAQLAKSQIEQRAQKEQAA